MLVSNMEKKSTLRIVGHSKTCTAFSFCDVHLCLAWNLFYFICTSRRQSPTLFFIAHTHIQRNTFFYPSNNVSHTMRIIVSFWNCFTVHLIQCESFCSMISLFLVVRNFSPDDCDFCATVCVNDEKKIVV